MRYFYVLNIKNKNLSTLLDGIRLIANPYIKHPAHITVRGPYDKKYNVDNINSDISGSRIKVEGVDDFYSYGQNTIFLKCNSEELKEATYKKDYPGSYNPHITLYDARDREFSVEIKKILKKYNFHFNVYSSGIEPLKSRGVGGVKNDTSFILEDSFFSNLNYYLKSNLDYNSILDLTNEERLVLIENLCKYFEKGNNPNIYASPVQRLINRLGLNEENGLFYLSNVKNWEDKFPFRIVKGLKEIKPYAVHCLFKNGLNTSDKLKPFNQPFILFFDNPDDERKIHKQVFSFGLAPIVFIEKLNSLEILNGYNLLKDQRKLQVIGDERIVENFTLEKLIHGHSIKEFYNSQFNNIKRVDSYLLENISEVREILIYKMNLTPSVSNSLIGRLIFIRYLIDRGVTFKEGRIYHFGNGSVKKENRNKLFVNRILNKDKLYEFFSFLRTKLNGDLFPVSDLEINSVTEEHLELLYYLFKGGKIKNSYQEYVIQDSLFDIYDFKIIPIELISNIYENFIGDVKRSKNKAFYTPSFLVDFSLSQDIEKYINQNDRVSCKVLDPSCGSGIFLIETLRKLIEKFKINNSNKISDSQLWKLVQDNIFGIDIDANAIDIAIFSLYVTVLDYKEPREISNSFKFKELKNINFFPDADYFDTKHSFNDVLKKVKLDFIIGNPPWGYVKESCYLDYIKQRKNKAILENDVPIDIGFKEISQAFIIRTQDFLSSSKNAKCLFIISSKALYNLSNPAKAWRNYFLNTYIVDKVIELSPVNNKIAGGYQIFDGARQPTVILSFQLPKGGNNVTNNLITHISIKPYLNHKLFKSFIISDYDVKKVKQKEFRPDKGGFDWVWKVLLHGNVLDVNFIKRLKTNYKTLRDFVEIENPKEGIKYKDGKRKFDTSKYNDWKFIETPSLNSYYLHSDKTWNTKAKELSNEGKINANHEIGYLTDDYFFKGEKVLIREALTKDFNAYCVYDNGNHIFNQSISSVKLKKGFDFNIEVSTLLKSIVGLFNSSIFTYYIFHTSSSAGVDRARAIISEFLSFPLSYHEGISDMVLSIQKLYIEYHKEDLFQSSKIERKIFKQKKVLEDLIMEAYQVKENEKSLIDYTLNVSIPLLKRYDTVFRTLDFKKKEDLIYIKKYIKVYQEKYEEEYGIKLGSKIYFNADYVGVSFMKSNSLDIKINKISSLNNIINSLGNLGEDQITKNLYYKKSVIGKEANGTFYIIKPNEFKSWHDSLARLELHSNNSSLFDKEVLKSKEVTNSVIRL